MNKLVFGLTAAAVAVSVTTASALTVTNRDAKPHALQITQGSDQKTVDIAPDQQLEGLCTETCQVLVDDDKDPYELEPTDLVQIEEGQLYYQEEPTTQQKPQ